MSRSQQEDPGSDTRASSVSSVATTGGKWRPCGCAHHRNATTIGLPDQHRNGEEEEDLDETRQHHRQEERKALGNEGHSGGGPDARRRRTTTLGRAGERRGRRDAARQHRRDDIGITGRRGDSPAGLAPQRRTTIINGHSMTLHRAMVRRPVLVVGERLRVVVGRRPPQTSSAGTLRRPNED